MPKGIVSTYDHENSHFWDMHSTYLTVPAFKKLHGRDRTVGKNKSSQIMWALVLVYDTGDDNPFRNIPVPERRDQIAENILDKPNFDWDKYQEQIDALLPMVTTQPQRSRDAQHNKMYERDVFMQGTRYTLDEFVDNNGRATLKKGTADQLDKMMSNTYKFYENLGRIDRMILLDDEKLSNKEQSESQDGTI